MLNDEVIDQYEPTIGVEIHVQLKTKTKLFSAVDNDARGKEPNSVVSPICFGLPGVLPVLNSEAVELAIKAGIALNAEVATFSKFDRKHYFYPDLPKGYQVTQYDQPTVGIGHVDVPLGGETFRVGITRAHLEEDAGKSIHPVGKNYSLVDLNRAGTPLLEIVSEPDIHSAEQARAFAQEIYYLMKFADVSNVDLYHGNMRFDVNVSVAKKGSTELGIRSEVKNLNSFKAVERASEYEIKRQIELLEKGKTIVQETRGWLDDKQKTISQRSKEDAHDYRYFPEPDLPPVVIEEAHIDEVRQSMPKLPVQIREELRNLDLDETVIQATMAIDMQLKTVLAINDDYGAKVARKTALWFMHAIKEFLELEDSKAEFAGKTEPIKNAWFKELSDMVDSRELNSNAAQTVFLEMIRRSNQSPRTIAEELKLIQSSDEGELGGIVDKVLEENTQAAEDVKNGEKKAIGFLVGQVMKESKGQANPQIVQKIIKEKLGGKNE